MTVLIVFGFFEGSLKTSYASAANLNFLLPICQDFIRMILSAFCDMPFNFSSISAL
jgi:hypothetical protein